MLIFQEWVLQLPNKISDLGFQLLKMWVFQQLSLFLGQGRKKILKIWLIFVPKSIQVSLFGEDEVKNSLFQLPEVEEMPLEQLLIFEKDLLGFYLHEPPFLKKLTQISDFVTCKISQLNEEFLGQKIKLGGVILETKKVMTKKSAQEMAFVRLSDGIAEIEVVVFPKLFGINKELLNKDTVILIDGRLDKREDNLSMIADGISLFNPENITEIEIMVPKNTHISVLQKVNKALRGYPGNTTCTLLLPNGGDIPKRMVLPFSIDLNDQLKVQIQDLLGKEAFKFI